MLADVDWSSVGVGLAFVVGAVFGVLVTLRLIGYLLELVLKMARRIDDDADRE